MHAQLFVALFIHDDFNNLWISNLQISEFFVVRKSIPLQKWPSISDKKKELVTYCDNKNFETIRCGLRKNITQGVLRQSKETNRLFPSFSPQEIWISVQQGWRQNCLNDPIFQIDYLKVSLKFYIDFSISTVSSFKKN